VNSIDLGDKLGHVEADNLPSLAAGADNSAAAVAK